MANRALGLLGDSIEILTGAIHYLSRPGAAALDASAALCEADRITRREGQ